MTDAKGCEENHILRRCANTFPPGVRRVEVEAVADQQRKTTVQSLRRGLEILVAVAQANRALGITELSRQCGLAKGSISRLVATLARQSFLTRDPDRAEYRLSTKIWELGIGALSQLDVRSVARSAMEALNAETRETVHLTVLTESDEMVFLDKLDSDLR